MALIQKMAGQILIFGGTGFYGRQVVAQLVKKGQPVKVLSRNAVLAAKLLGPEVSIIEGDVTQPGIIEKALEGVAAVVICLSAMSNQLIRKMQSIERDAVLSILARCQDLGIGRVVYLSGYELRRELLEELHVPEFGAIKIEVETSLEDSELNWTILGSAPAFEIFFAFVRNGRMAVPGGGLKAIPTIAPEDVGELTAQTVLREDLGGQRIKLTGPRSYTFPEVAEMISRIGGVRVRHIKVPLILFNIVSWLVKPLFPFVRYLYKSLKMLNHFPQDLAEGVPRDHQFLLDHFNYEPRTLEREIERRYGRA